MLLSGRLKFCLCGLLLFCATSLSAWHLKEHRKIGQLAYDRIKIQAPEIISDLDVLALDVLSLGAPFGMTSCNDPEFVSRLNDSIQTLWSFVGGSAHDSKDAISLNQAMDPLGIALAQYGIARSQAHECFSFREAQPSMHQEKDIKHSQHLIKMAGQHLAEFLIEALTDKVGSVNHTPNITSYSKVYLEAQLGNRMLYRRLESDFPRSNSSIPILNKLWNWVEFLMGPSK